MHEHGRAPRWSWKTWATAAFCLVSGLGLLLLSATAWVTSDLRATNLASAGESIIMTAIAAIFGRAGLETWKALGERRASSDRRADGPMEGAE